MKYFLYIAIFLFTTNLSSQSLDEEIGFLYTKAKYLISTDRGEDAIKVLNQIISKDKNYEDALLLRAEAKYELGAYAGVRKDLGEYMANNGITSRVARLYGLADFQGGKEKAALNSLNLALLEIKNDKLLYETRAGLLEKEGTLLQACKDYRAAARLGSSKSKRRADRLCGKEETERPQSSKNDDKKQVEDKKEKNNTKKDKKNTSTKSDIKKVIIKNDKSKTNEPDVKNEKQNEPDLEGEEVNIEEPEDDKEEEAEDPTVNEIEVDDELTILISGEGLGSREVMNQPNVLIISDQSGSVYIDICVSRGGRVTSATFDNINSTIKKQSLVSLAVRKAKEFWFDAGIGNDKCGKIVFQISTGS